MSSWLLKHGATLLGQTPSIQGVRRIPRARAQCRLRTQSTNSVKPSTPTSRGSQTALLTIGVAFAAGSAGYVISRWQGPAVSKFKHLELSQNRSTLALGDVEPPKYDNSVENLGAAHKQLQNVLGEKYVLVAEDELKLHSGNDWSSYNAKATEKPSIVILPSSTAEVVQIVKICHDLRIPMTPYSGGTSLEGHFSPLHGGVTIEFRRMDKIVKLHKADLDVVVQPGVNWELLNEELAKDGLFFPPDPGPGAQIGGMVACGCSGTNAYRYGTMRDWVLSLVVVMADGTVIKTRQRPRKSSAGYDLTKMFIGSEGTLGIVTEATLKLTPLPENTKVAVAAFPTVRHAASVVSSLVQMGLPIGAMELLDDVQMKCINEAGSTSREWAESPTLFLKFTGTSSANKEAINLVEQISQQNGMLSFEMAKNKDEMDELWSARKEALWAVVALKKDEKDHVWTTDVAVAISLLPPFIEETKQDIKNSGLLGTIVGHVGDGNFHSFLLWRDGQEELVEGLVHRMVKRALALEGTATGEHGVGIIKRDYLEHELGIDTVDAMRKLKQAFDPLCLLNSEKVIRMTKPKPEELKHW